MATACAVRRWVNRAQRPFAHHAADGGLPEGSRRRTPLRREEVAQLCGISVTWYTWIEPGREVSVSPSVWSRIAGVAARAERAYLFELADCADPQPPRATTPAARQAAARLRGRDPAPAYVLDRAWNLLAWNEPLRELFDDWPCAIPNPICCATSSWTPRASGGLGAARRVVAEFRADAGAHLDEPAVLALADALNRQSPVFAHWWTRQRGRAGLARIPAPAQASWRSSRSPFDWPRIRT